MIPAEIIRNKREGHALSKEEICFMAEGAAHSSIPDYQLSAWLMAVFFRGMNVDETFWLTEAIKNSGHSFDWKKLNPKLRDFSLVDKHSTGGVGDKVSLILVPLAIELGLRVPMMSGRGLGHTGGTVDKLLSIPGFRMDFALDRASKIIEEVGACMLSQTDELCPADKKFYHLRDVTATVESFSLIAASIVSKKWAEGCESIVYDVKYGEGAFMENIARAEELAQWLMKISHLANLKSEVVISRMEEPLGTCIGNALEIKEALWILKNSYPSPVHKEIASPLVDLTCRIAARMAIVGGTRKDFEKTVAECQQLLSSGKTVEHFYKLAQAQGAIEAWGKKLPVAKKVIDVLSPHSGFVNEIRSRELGLLGLEIGVGRKKMEDVVSSETGFELLVSIGTEVKKGDLIARLHLRETDDEGVLTRGFLECLIINGIKKNSGDLVWKILQH